MSTERLIEVQRRKPFRPFFINTADGNRYLVSHPEALAYNPKGRTAVLITNDDRSVFLDLLLIASLEDAPADQAA